MVKRLALYGEFGCGNLGNEGSLDAFLAYLRTCHSDVELHCICRCPDAAATRFGLTTTSITTPRHGRGYAGRLYSLLAKALDLARLTHIVGRYDAVVVPGTGILEDSMSLRSWGVPWELACLAVAARLRHIPLSFVCIGGNAPATTATRRLFRATLRTASYRSFRDAPSRTAAADLGVLAAHNDGVYADLAFTLPVPANRSAGSEIGLGVMSYYGRGSNTAQGQQTHDRYVDQQVTIVRALLEGGRTVRLLIGDSADKHVADAIISRVQAPTEQLSAIGARSLGELLVEMTSCQVVVASRYHNVVCAALLGLPTVSLGHSEKNDTLQNLLGLSAYCAHIEQIDPEMIVAQVQELVTEYNTHHARINDVVAGFRRQLEAQYAELDSVLFGCVRTRPGKRQAT